MRWQNWADGQRRRDRRRDRGVRDVRGPLDAPAPGRRPHVRRGLVSRGRADPAPGPDRLRVLRDPRGRGRVRVDGQERARSVGAISSGRSRSCSASRRSPTSSRSGPLRCLVLAGPAGRGVPRRTSAGHVPDAPGAGPPAPEREPVAELSSAIGCRRASGRSRPATTRSSSSGAGRAGSSSSYSLRPLGVAHAVISADPVPGRHVPALAVLPAAAVVDQAVRAGRARHAARYERYDWNSLLADEPEHRAIMPTFMDGTSYFPVAAGDGAEPRGVRRADRRSASATAAAGRRPAARTARRGSSSRRPTASTAADARLRDRRRRALAPATPGMELAAPLRRHPRRRDATPASGLHHRQAELRVRARVRACSSGPAGSCSPRRRPAKLSVNTKSLRRRSARATSSRTRTTCSAAASAILNALDRAGRRDGEGAFRRHDCAAPTARPTWRSRPTTSSPRPASLRRCATCRRSASRRSGRAGCPR